LRALFCVFSLYFYSTRTKFNRVRDGQAGRTHNSHILECLLVARHAWHHDGQVLFPLDIRHHHFACGWCHLTHRVLLFGQIEDFIRKEKPKERKNTVIYLSSKVIVHHRSSSFALIIPQTRVQIRRFRPLEGNAFCALCWGNPCV